MDARMHDRRKAALIKSQRHEAVRDGVTGRSLAGAHDSRGIGVIGNCVDRAQNWETVDPRAPGIRVVV
jgi:hypothetical protein